MLLFSRPEDCCGCTACQNVCPNKAISMQPDGKGFLYPNIDPALCINCGLCRRVCPMERKPLEEEPFAPNPIFIAVKHKSDAVRMQSSSGGMFTAVSDWILGQSGAVYGAAFDDEFRVCHRRAVTEVDRNAFRGSKYVQSDLGLTYNQVKSDISSGLTVLFTGTPCQIAGLRLFLASNRCNLSSLYLCDLICHGVPSPKLWEDYRLLLSKQYRSDFLSYTFRDKKQGWRDYNVEAIFKNEIVVSSDTNSLIYIKLFAKDIDLRPCCYHCPFANLHRPSDLTIGDFWGIEKTIPDFEDDKGVSLALINTIKGHQMFQKIKRELDIREIEPEQGLQWNLKKPSSPSSLTEAFWLDYQKHGFQYVIKKYAEGGFKGEVKNIIKSILKTLGIYPFIKSMLRKE